MPRWRSALIREIERAAIQPGVRDRQADVGRWLRAAEMYYVTKDMTAVAMDASADMPTWTPAAIMPEPIGLVVWAGELPLLRRQEMRGLLWVTYGGSVHMYPLLVKGGQVEMAAAEALPVAEEVPTGITGSAAGVLYLVGATWTLMQQPTVTTPRSIRGAADSSRLMRQLPRRVTVIDLRPMRHVTADRDPDHPERVYTHRWIVRGHWRNQRVGPDRAGVRRTWVPSYTKGPDGAPLLARERVNVWRR